MYFFNAALCGFVTGATLFLVQLAPKETDSVKTNLNISTGFLLGALAGLALTVACVVYTGVLG